MRYPTRILIAFALLLTLTSSFAYAASQDLPNENIASDSFSLVVCDGPALPANMAPDGYRVCDFNAVMREAQHLMNIMVILGVLAAIVGFSYAGFLYIARGDSSEARGEANSVFKKVFIGFIIMLLAWFVVYQVIDWIQCKSGDPKCVQSGTTLLSK